MLQKFNPGTVWKQRTATSPEDTAPSDPALFSFEFGQDGFLETQELMTQFLGTLPINFWDCSLFFGLPAYRG